MTKPHSPQDVGDARESRFLLLGAVLGLLVVIPQILEMAQ
jgi:hypothetical protein